ncbi:ABC transporter ATP-binding protein [Paracoccus fistulariae]|uniref:Sn-glycerol-3-phosphate ABC transporter ATP-binding protein UgpC n=1 Tax=Paracoccus fistulariae TaxID=658446 RepID=A0ABY7SLV1_9RHOB|nr:sn-glycerol-3-phosphate ABC transporter ATP-binding protein UgpC [Paracoccus fistulariae]MDB6180797.1 sn-glycerol-3-phosphate ABC transporter ATP-binding protein UgpC [Paracoccus fistulariae]WCR06982.1 sn-glycerol-3-phosphate ABC transporter ATP-binding protein UgpC [Paracoccus fistulariae]
MSGLELTDVNKIYGDVHVIHDVNLTVEPGEFCVFVGPSGCGKSTLLRMVAGLEDISDGTLDIGGTPMNDVDPSKRGVAMVFQSYALYPHLSVRENMGFGLRFDKTPKAEIQRRVNDAARVLQLDHLLDRKPKALSGGQRQRVAIGRAIVRKPEVFLFDEPLSNLDAELRVNMRVEIARLHKELGATIIYVTHDQVEAMTLADKIVVLRAGRVEQVGAPLDLYDDPDNIFIAGFIGSPKMNFLPATVVEVAGEIARITLDSVASQPIPFRLPQGGLTVGQKVTVGIRPEHLLQDGPAKIQLTTDIVEHLGGESYVYAHDDGDTRIIMKLGDARDVRPGGHPITACFDPARAYLFDADGNRCR